MSCYTGAVLRRLEPVRVAIAALAPCLAVAAAGCNDGPQTFVVLENDYPQGAAAPLVVYQAYWQAVSFQAPVSPGSASAPQTTVAASANAAYALIAPGWDPTSST